MCPWRQDDIDIIWLAREYYQFFYGIFSVTANLGNLLSNFTSHYAVMFFYSCDLSLQLFIMCIHFYVLLLASLLSEETKGVEDW